MLNDTKIRKDKPYKLSDEGDLAEWEEVNIDAEQWSISFCFHAKPWRYSKQSGH
ncbi:MAG: hypothetical protein RQ715_05920 [Methylococcales bacterium]|nr:hypothetical protein [Methylococcales bacterium]